MSEYEDIQGVPKNLRFFERPKLPNDIYYSKDWYYMSTSLISKELADLEEKLYEISFPMSGIVVFTDSEELISNIYKSQQFYPDISTGQIEPTGKLFYITEGTNKPNITTPRGDRNMIRMGENSPADVLFDPLSNIAVINAWDRFKSLQSIVLGIRGYEKITQGVLPMHSALLEKKGDGYLIVGGAGNGKSTLSLSLANTGYNLLSDDWIDLYEKDGYFSAKSTMEDLSIGVGETFDKLDSKLKKNIINKGFLSYGKYIFPRRILNEHITNEVVQIKKIILLDNHNLNDNSAEGFIKFQRFSNPHLPFVNLDNFSYVLNSGNDSLDKVKMAQSNYLRMLHNLFYSKIDIVPLANKNMGVRESINLLRGILV